MDGLLARPRVPARPEPPATAGRRQVLVHVEEDGTRKLPGPKGVTPLTGGIEVVANVHDAQPARVSLLDLPGEPGGGDDRVHAPAAYFIFVMGFGTFL